MHTQAYAYVLVMWRAVGGSEDPEENVDLHAAIVRAKAVNLPKDKIEAAIKRGADHQASGG